MYISMKPKHVNLQNVKYLAHKWCAYYLIFLVLNNTDSSSDCFIAYVYIYTMFKYESFSLYPIHNLNSCGCLMAVACINIYTMPHWLLILHLYLAHIIHYLQYCLHAATIVNTEYYMLHPPSYNRRYY